jgi:hypothetical protein
VLVAHDASGLPAIDWAWPIRDVSRRWCCSTPTTTGPLACAPAQDRVVLHAHHPHRRPGDRPALARPDRRFYTWQVGGFSAVAGVDTASAAHSPHLLDAVRDAFVSGMNVTHWVSAALIAAGVVLGLVHRPRIAAAPLVVEPDTLPQDAAA